jgi:hypothetical protein
MLDLTFVGLAATARPLSRMAGESPPATSAPAAVRADSSSTRACTLQTTALIMKTFPLLPRIAPPTLLLLTRLPAS